MATPSWSACCHRPRLTPRCAAIDETLAAEETIGRKYGLQSANLRMVFNAQAKHRHFHGLPLRYPAPVEVARAGAGRRHVCPRRHHPGAHADRGERPPPLRRQPARRLERLHRQTVHRRPALRHGHPGGLGPHGVLNGNRRAGGLARVAPHRRDPTRGAGDASARDGRSPKHRRDRCCFGTPACGTPAAPIAATSRATR